MITVSNISKEYEIHGGKRTVLDKVSFELRKGQKIGILGRNGAGKSTLIRIVSGSEHPTSGHVRRTMSLSWPLAFTGGFQGSLTGMDNLKFICRVYNRPFKPLIPFVEEFSELGLYMREPVKRYSSGMRARLAFALSLAVEFDCYLIDEVVAVGDDRFHQKCYQELFINRSDRAKIMASHDAHFIRKHCDCAAVLVRGKFTYFPNVNDAFRYYSEHAAE